MNENVKPKKSLQHLLKHMMLGFVLLLSVTSVYSQNQKVQGTITDESNYPIPGVNILIKGTLIGTVTDIDGKYTLDLSNSENPILVISYIGYLTEEIDVGTQTVIDILLTPDLKSLEEVVVIGYGTQKKKLVTGATAQVKGDDLEKRNSTNALQAMQGQVAGVNIASTSGQPGEGMKVTIRGVGTIGNSAPLYIVDGIQTGDIKYLNSADIESMDVLKDAASAAIYGSRAANGVILITTKKGKSGDAMVTLDAYQGVQNRPKDFKLLNSDDYAMIMNEQAGTGTPPFDLTDLPAYNQKGVANTDWLDEMFVKNALTQNLVLGVTGGSEQTTYSMSLSYTGTEGIVGGSSLSNYERYGARFNSENKLYNGKVRVGENLTLSYIKNNGIAVGNQYGNSLRPAFGVSPLLPMYDDNGEYFNTADKTLRDQNGKSYWYDKEANPYASMYYNNQNTNNTQKVLGNVYAEIELIRNLIFKSSVGVDYSTSENRTFTPIYQLSAFSFSDFSKASQNMSKGLGLTFDNLLTYSLTLGSHKIDGMIGMSSQQYNGSWMYGQNSDLAFDDLEHAWLNNASNQEWAKLSLQGAPYDEDKLLSYFGRVQYAYNETYLFNATFRADGSSKFAEGNRWGYFPSVSGGWVMSNESFMESTKAFMDFFKLRASWGQNGNQSISSFQYLAPIKFTQATYNYGDTEAVNNLGSYPNRLPNDDLQWETSEQTNIGFDAKFLNSRLSANFDWYNKITKDWLIISPVLATAGADAPYVNGGNVTNTGVELALSFSDNLGDFEYSINANGAFNKNYVNEIPTEDGIIHGATNTAYTNSPEFYRAELGHPIGYFWGFEMDGLFQNTSDVENYVDSVGNMIMPDAQPGDIKIVDRNNDGILNDLDKMELGDPNPDFIYGLTLSCNYKAFDFLVVTNGVAGNQIVQTYRDHTNKYANYSEEILGRWTGEGTSNSIPRVTNANINYTRFTSLFVKNGDYYRISNLTLGFDFAKVFTIKNVSQLRFYASAQNLYTFTKYTGMDPEVGYGFDNGETDKFSSGIDIGYYPRPRTFLLGVSVKF